MNIVGRKNAYGSYAQLFSVIFKDVDFLNNKLNKIFSFVLTIEWLDG